MPKKREMNKNKNNIESFIEVQINIRKYQPFSIK